MPRWNSTKSEEEQASSLGVRPTLGEYVTFVLNRTSDPERKQFRRTDVEFARYVIRNMAAVLAAHGPRSLNEHSSSGSTPVECADQIPKFDRGLGPTAEWKNSLAYVSDLTAIGVALVCSTKEEDPSFTVVLTTVDLLSCVQRRIVEVLELGITA